MSKWLQITWGGSTETPKSDYVIYGILWKQEGNISREIAILCNGNLCQWGWKAVTKNIFKDKTVWVWRIMLHSRGRLNCLVNTQIWGWQVGRFCSNQNNAESNWRRCFYHQIWCWWYHQTNLHPCPIIGSISKTTFHKWCFIQSLIYLVFSSFFNWSA